MANRVQNLPFTGYDIVGYLVPGVTFFVLSGYAWHGLKIFERIDLTFDNLGGASLIFVSIVLSYVAGHCIAIVSALSVERIVVISFGYPSSYLVRPLSMADIRNNCLAKKLNLFVASVMAPITLITISAISITGAVFHFIKKLDDKHVELIDASCEKRFGIGASDVSGPVWFPLIQHDVLLGESASVSRMYNYLNIYGFCRNMASVMTFVGCLAFGRTIFFRETSPQHIYIFAWCASLAAVILTLGFIKFFRRYSQEAIMAFIVKNSGK